MKPSAPSSAAPNVADTEWTRDVARIRAKLVPYLRKLSAGDDDLRAPVQCLLLHERIGKRIAPGLRNRHTALIDAAARLRIDNVRLNSLGIDSDDHFLSDLLSNVVNEAIEAGFMLGVIAADAAPSDLRGGAIAASAPDNAPSGGASSRLSA